MVAAAALAELYDDGEVEHVQHEDDAAALQRITAAASAAQQALIAAECRGLVAEGIWSWRPWTVAAYRDPWDHRQVHP